MGAAEGAGGGCVGTAGVGLEGAAADWVLLDIGGGLAPLEAALALAILSAFASAFLAILAAWAWAALAAKAPYASR